jgi:hypothetical protein
MSEHPTGTGILDLTMDPREAADIRLKEAGLNGEGIPGSEDWMKLLMERLNGPAVKDPYQAADEGSRAGQLGSLQRTTAAIDGPSLAMMQGRQAQEQLMRQGAGAVAGGNPLAAHAALNQLAQSGAALGQDQGQARLAEWLGLSGKAGQGASQLRGQDLTGMSNRLNSAFGAQDITNRGQMGAAQQGMTIQDAVKDAALQRYALHKKLELQSAKNTQNNWGTIASAGGTILKLLGLM